MHCGAGQGGSGEQAHGAAVPDVQDWLCPGLQPLLAPGEAAVVPRDLSCAQHPQPDVRGGPGHISGSPS